MSKLADLKIRPKLIILFILTGILPLLIAGYYRSQLAATARMEKSFSQLSTIQNIQTAYLESVFAQRRHGLGRLARSRQTLEFSQALIKFYGKKEGALKILSSEFNILLKENTAHLQPFAKSYGCQELKIIDKNYGRIIFSLKNKQALGDQLNESAWAETSLGQVYKTILTTDRRTTIDFQPFEPEGGTETAFFSEPIRDNTGRMVVIIVIQVTSDFIDKFMGSRKGMGETNESYLLDFDRVEKRFEFRSNLTTLGGGRHVVGYELETQFDYWLEAVDKGVEGSSGLYADSAGKDVLAAFNKLKIKGLDWKTGMGIEPHGQKPP